MELKNLNTFLRVAEIGNFTKAAEDLGYAQSTITTQIHQLEEEIGAPLFDRIGKKVYLTSYGCRLIEYANQMQNLEQQILSMKGIGDEAALTGTLRIGAVESIASSILIPVLEAYYKLYPQVKIQIISGITVTLLDMLRHNEVDIIFTMGTMADQNDCLLLTSHKEQAVFAAHPDHPLAGRKSVSVSELLDYPMILNREQTLLQQELYRISMVYGKPLKGTIQAESAGILCSLAERNMGIVFVAEYLMKSQTPKRNLCVIPVSDFSLKFHIYVYYHKNKWITPQMQKLVDLTEEYWSQGTV